MDERKILQKIGELNIQQGTSAFSKFGCKNEGFVTAMVTKGAELHRDAFTLTKEGEAVFKDGSRFKCDAIVACTGYKNSFPFFETNEVADKLACFKCGMPTKMLSQFGMNPRRLYKQARRFLFFSSDSHFGLSTRLSPVSDDERRFPRP